MATPLPDDFALSGWFVVKLDGGPIAEESYFLRSRASTST